MSGIFFGGKLRMKVDENNVVPDSNRLYGVNPYNVPKVYLAGLGDFDVRRNGWNKDSVVLVKDNTILEYTQSNFVERLVKDKEGNKFWVDERRIALSEDWAEVSLDQLRDARDYTITEYNLDTFEKKKYKMVLEDISNIDDWDMHRLEDYWRDELIDDPFVVDKGTLKQYLGQDSILIIPDSVVEIGKDAFSHSYCFKSIWIPKSLTNIPEYFYKLCSTKHIAVAEDNPRYYVENGCLIDRQTATLVLAYAGSFIPNDGSVNKIGPHAFSGRSDIASIVIPDAIQEIANDAFACCYWLKEISIPVALENMIENIFGKQFVKKENKWIAQEKEIPSSNNPSSCRFPFPGLSF